MALPLVPRRKVEDAFVEHDDNTPYVEGAVAFTDFFLETWIEGRFSPGSWNHFNTKRCRTNNDSECYNNRLQRILNTN
jgi:hypothetical protein